tara:strand:- start:1982 stop:2614 length:633 start_codon:yes stop_codon:yes gene_type:complete
MKGRRYDVPAKTRYSAAKKKQKIDVAGDSWKAPAMWSDKRSDICNAAIRSVDKIARDLEMKWGIGKLEELAPPKLAVAFEQARQNFSDAANGDDHNYLVQKADNLIQGWKAVEAYAIKNGRTPADEEVWYAIAPPDAGEYNFAIVKNGADAASVDREKYSKVYTLDEICRIIQKFETDMIAKTKKLFPNATITKISTSNNKDISNDEIPF